MNENIQETMNAIDGLKVIISNLREVVGFLFSFISNENFNGLMIAIIGGEITLITLFFALIPMLLEKRKSEYYLGTKVTDFFLFHSSKQGELLKTWIYGMTILIVNILLCFFDCMKLGYFCAGIFFAYMTYKIYIYLNFISNENDIRTTIKDVSKQRIKDESTKLIEDMVITSNSNWICVRENMQFLYEQQGDNDLVGCFVDRLFEQKTEYKKKIFFLIENFIDKKKYCYDMYLDTHELYKFFRNTLDDYNKEDLYGVIYALIMNDFNLCTKDRERRSNYAIVILDAIENSSMTNANKRIVKEHVMIDLDECIYRSKTSKIGEESYYSKFKYIFDVMKHLINNNDADVFKEFLRRKGRIDSEDTFVIDLYTTCMIYLYYLIKIEDEHYIARDDKRNMEKIKQLLMEKYDFDYVVAMIHYYEKKDEYLDNLRKASSWWDIMNMEDVKTCVVPPMIETVSKCFFLIFGREFVYGKYSFSPRIIDIFKYDIKEGRLDRRDRFIDFFEFIGYESYGNDFNAFETQYAEYIIREYKEKELLNEIDKVKLQVKLNSEKETLEELLPKVKLFNAKNLTELKRIEFSSVLNKGMLDTYYQKRSILPLDEIERKLEQRICLLISETIDDKRYGGITKWKEIPSELQSFDSGYYYIRPKIDRLGHIPGMRDLYSEVISKFNLVDTSIMNMRLLIEDYKCCFGSVSVQLKEIGSDEVDLLKKKYCVSDGKYYRSGDNGVEILYTEDEIEEIIKKTHIGLDVVIEVGLEVSGERNVVFIQGEAPVVADSQ